VKSFHHSHQPRLPGHLGVVGCHPRCGRTAGEGPGESQGAFSAGDLLLGPVVEPLTTKQQADIGQLVGGFKHFLFSIIYGIIIPTDFHIFQRGWNHQLARYFMICLIYTSQEMPWNVPPYPDYGWIYHHYQSLVDIISLYPCMWIYIYPSQYLHICNNILHKSIRGAPELSTQAPWGTTQLEG